MAEDRSPGAPRVGEPALRILEPLAHVGLADEGARSLLDAAPDAVVVVDETGVMILVNRQAEHLFGFDRDELIGMPIEALLPENVRDTTGCTGTGMASNRERGQWVRVSNFVPDGPMVSSSQWRSR